MDEIKALFKSGKHEDANVAIRKLNNVPAEWEWLRQYAISRPYLPMGFKSWSHLYGDCAKRGFLRPNITLNRNTFTQEQYHEEAKYEGSEWFEISIADLQRNVANEILFFQTFFDTAEFAAQIATYERINRFRIMGDGFRPMVDAANQLLGLIYKG